MKNVISFIEWLLKRFGLMTLVAFILSTITLSFIPKKIITLLPFDNQNNYWVLAILFCTVLIIENLTKILFCNIKAKRDARIAEKKQREEVLETDLQYLWETVDSFSLSDKELIKQFLTTENTPTTPSYISYDYRSLLNSDLVISTYQATNEKKEGFNTLTGEFSSHNITQRKIYKLRPEIYELLKYSKLRYGRISNFD